MSRATNSERSPLLRIQSRQSDATSFSTAAAAVVAPSTTQVTAVCLLLAVAQQAAALLAALAAEDLNRAAACGHLADDERCRSDAVLRELSGIAAVEAVLTAATAVLAPIPIGAAADRWGRRPFLVLALMGGLLNTGSRMIIYGFPRVFPLRLTWLSTSFELFTGGETAFFAVIYTILTDVTSKAQRSTSFFYLVAVNMLAAQIALKFRDLVITDKFGPWPSLVAAFGSFVFAILCAYCIPETMHLSKTTYNEEAVEEEPAAQTAMQRIRTAMPAAYKQVTTSMAALFWHNKRLAILLITLLVVALNAQAMGSFLLYTSFRYQLPFDKINSIYTAEIFSHFLLNALVLPLAAHAMLSYHFSARRKDTTFVRWGLVAAALGLLGIGLAPNIGPFIAALVLYAFITAYNGGILGLLSQLTGEDHVAAMFATTRVLATVGGLLSIPLFNALFQLGANRGKVWSGLPYLVLGCICALTAAVVFVVTSTQPERDAEQDDQN